MYELDDILCSILIAHDGAVLLWQLYYYHTIVYAHTLTGSQCRNLICLKMFHNLEVCKIT